MKSKQHDSYTTLNVQSFEKLIETPFAQNINAICFERSLKGDFAEIVHHFDFTEHMIELTQTDLRMLNLSEQGSLARQILLNDMELLQAQGADPTLNLIQNYERDKSFPFFPTDVYSFHVDRSPIPTNTFLCTYYGDATEIVPNSQAKQKIQVPQIREELQKHFGLKTEELEAFFTEHFFDLHYLAEPHASIIQCGVGNLWKLAVDHPQSEVLPCLHRAPAEKSGLKRLLLIC